LTKICCWAGQVSKRMNIHFNIDWHGHLDISELKPKTAAPQPATDKRYAIYGRTDQNKIHLYLDDEAEYDPFIKLLDFLRALHDHQAVIYNGHGTIAENLRNAPPNHITKQSDLCLLLGKLCLFAFEKQSQSQFSSHLSVFPASLAVADTLPFLFLNLGQIYRLNEPSFENLEHVDSEILLHGSLFRLDANHLCIPQNISSICGYPEQLHQLEFDELMQTEYGKWVDLVARASLSVRQPLLHFGTLKEQSSDTDKLVFYRAIIPFAGTEDQPKDFRILVLSYSPQRQLWGL
jgi:hypothetical protein